jgi:hypothetical protein
MSKPIPPEKDREDEGNPSTENQPENEKKLSIAEIPLHKFLMVGVIDIPIATY